MMYVTEENFHGNVSSFETMEMMLCALRNVAKGFYGLKVVAVN